MHFNKEARTKEEFDILLQKDLDDLNLPLEFDEEIRRVRHTLQRTTLLSENELVTQLRDYLIDWCNRRGVIF